jgi:hypothetical protein
MTYDAKHWADVDAWHAQNDSKKTHIAEGIAKAIAYTVLFAFLAVVVIGLFELAAFIL